MEQRIEVGGHGGQGVVVMSFLLAELAMRKGLNVTWFPSYGAEMRGGAASCAVRLSREPIESPLIGQATHVLALNHLSLLKLQCSHIPDQGQVLVIDGQGRLSVPGG